VVISMSIVDEAGCTLPGSTTGFISLEQNAKLVFE